MEELNLFSESKFLKLSPVAKLVVFHFFVYKKRKFNYEAFVEINTHEIIGCDPDGLEIDIVLKEIKQSKFELPKQFVPPTPEEARNYILEHDLMDTASLNQIDEMVTMFLNYYGMVDWMVGYKSTVKKMQNWKKALNNWVSRPWNKKEYVSKINESIKAFNMLQNLKS